MRALAWLTAALAFPALARAQEPAPLPPIPLECQNHPTNPCGYPSAPPAAQDGSYPPPIVLPPLGAPEPPPAPSPPPPLPQDAWRYRLDARGELWRERTVHKPHAHGVWISGLALFLSGYLGSAPFWFGGLGGSPVGILGPWPVFGAFVNGAVAGGGSASAGWIMSGVGQLSGLVLIFVGAGAGGRKVQRERVQYSVAPISGGVASALGVRF